MLLGIFIIALSAVVGFPVFYYLIYEPLRIFSRVVYLNYYSRLDDAEKKYLSANFAFYAALSAPNQLRFERRVAFFLRYKKFSGIDIPITDEMKIFVSASAVQLTFGLRNFWITEFDQFHITADNYQLAGFSHKAMGHVSEKGIITLSWKNLREGYSNPSDGINVGLHEMAHALMISSVERGWNITFAMEFHEWEKVALPEWKKGRSERAHILRSYAYANEFEFFAVCVEYFFEKAAQLSSAYPLLYNEMQRLLRLNPLLPSDPRLKHIPVVYPPQPIPLPKYSFSDIVHLAFKSPKNIFCFVAGTCCWALGACLIWQAVVTAGHHPQSSGNEIPLSQFAGLAFALAFFLYIQVFFEVKRKPN